eukprot:Hpha_TRINITY_DN16488_c1_g16::TRINITY_DN16488_c1_g16_i1::g.163238::m.163238
MAHRRTLVAALVTLVTLLFRPIGAEYTLAVRGSLPDGSWVRHYSGQFTVPDYAFSAPSESDNIVYIWPGMQWPFLQPVLRGFAWKSKYWDMQSTYFDHKTCNHSALPAVSAWPGYCQGPATRVQPADVVSFAITYQLEYANKSSLWYMDFGVNGTLHRMEAIYTDTSRPTLLWGLVLETQRNVSSCTGDLPKNPIVVSNITVLDQDSRPANVTWKAVEVPTNSKLAHCKKLRITVPPTTPDIVMTFQ